MNPTKIAIVQESCVYLDLKASVQKALKLIDEAANNGANILVFGETWFSGYPSWLDYVPHAARWNHPPVKEVWAQTFDNAMEVNGPEVALLAEAAKKTGVFLIIGFNEAIRKGRGNGTIYNSILMMISDLEPSPAR